MEQPIRFCTSFDGVRIAYTTTGNGPPFVKAANYLSHLEYDWESPVWGHWMKAFSEKHTLLRYDQRGCGLSDWEVDAHSVDSWVRDLEQVVDELGIEHFPLLGTSQGGPVAIEYALRNPEKVSHLILYGTYARGRFKRNPSQAALEEAEALLKLMKVGWGQDNPAFRQVFTTLFMPDATLEQMQWFNELQRRSTSPEGALRLERAFYNIDVSESASRVAVPSLVLHARHDHMIPFEEGRQLAAMLPNARFVPLASQNHLLLEEEAAWQRLLSDVYRFIGLAAPTPAKSRPDRDTLFHELTKRELEVLDLLARGLRNAEIAEQLYLSPKTVRNYLSNIFSKLDVADRGQAIVMAREHGLGISEE